MSYFGGRKGATFGGGILIFFKVVPIFESFIFPKIKVVLTNYSNYRIINTILSGYFEFSLVFFKI